MAFDGMVLIFFLIVVLFKLTLIFVLSNVLAATYDIADRAAVINVQKP